MFYPCSVKPRYHKDNHKESSHVYILAKSDQGCKRTSQLCAIII